MGGTGVDLAAAHAVARAAAREFGLPDDVRLDFVKHRENHVFRVRGGGVDAALRLHRPGYRTDDQLRAELEVLAAFGTAGLAVPRPLLSRTGGEVVAVADEDGVRRQATMLGWFADTEPLADSAAVLLGAQRPGRLAELGELAARLHEVASRLPAGTGAGRAAWDAAGLVGPAALWGSATGSRSLDDAGRATLAAAEARLVDDLAALPRGRDRYGCIHADLTFENVLLGPDGLVAIDFDDSGYGWYLFDLATTFLWCTRHPDAAGLLAELTGGYRRVRALTAVDAAAWEPLLLARALSYLGWSAARPGDPVSQFHEEQLVPWVLEAARRYLAEGRTGWPSLADCLGPHGE